MLLATASDIRKIDNYATEQLGISEYDLIGRAGMAVASSVRRHVKEGGKILIFAGKGNNGADGYAAAKALMNSYDVAVYDVFGIGQNGSAGKLHFSEFLSLGGEICAFKINGELEKTLTECDCIIDAIFGVGFKGELPLDLVEFARMVNEISGAYKIAIDVPLGVKADDGSVISGSVISVDVTVSLTFLKPGLVSYPAKEYVGIVENDNLNLPISCLNPEKDAKLYYVDKETAVTLVPQRRSNSNKGTYGKVLLLTGSSQYPGAGRLTLEAALRGGAGLVSCCCEAEQKEALLSSFPEAIYKSRARFENFGDADIKEAHELSSAHSVTLIGSGCYCSSALGALTAKLLSSTAGTLVLDADAINALAYMGARGRELIKNSERTVILTPHPLEFSRLAGITVEEVQSHRLELAVSFAKEYGCILILKGAATVVTDGSKVYINSSGTSALAKAGSGDVLAGFLASMLAWHSDPLKAAALSVYCHGAAGDALADEFSEIGVTPSDLPKEMARVISVLGKTRQK